MGSRSATTEDLSLLTEALPSDDDLQVGDSCPKFKLLSPADETHCRTHLECGVQARWEKQGCLEIVLPHIKEATVRNALRLTTDIFVMTKHIRKHCAHGDTLEADLKASRSLADLFVDSREYSGVGKLQAKL
jgi:hypothetical protein